MSSESSAAHGSVGDVISKIGKAVSDGAEGDGPPELMLTQEMRVWDSVPMAETRATAPAAPAMDEPRIRELIEETVLTAISSNAEIGALIRKAAQPSSADVEGAVRAAVGPLIDQAVAERLGDLRQAVLSSVTDQLTAQHAEIQAAAERIVDVRQSVLDDVSQQLSAQKAEMRAAIEAAPRADEIRETVMQDVSEQLSAQKAEMQVAVESASRTDGLRESVMQDVTEQLSAQKADLQAAVEAAERVGDLRQKVMDEMSEQLSAQKSELEAAFEEAEEGRKKQARKAVRAELKALLAGLDDGK